jgi:copper chaperone
MNQLTMKVAGMTCGHCVSQVTRALESLDGVRVQKVEVGAAAFEYDPAATTEERIKQAIEDQGYSVTATGR